MPKRTTPPATKSPSWGNLKTKSDWSRSPGAFIARKLTVHAECIQRGDERGLEAFYEDALELKKYYPQYGKFINRAILTVQSPASMHILERIEWMVERNADPSEYYKAPVKD